MRYHGRINYVKCLEWGLSMAQGALFDLLNESSSWAKTHIIGDDVYYWVSRNKVLDELPVAYSKSDTVYRHLKLMAKKGLIFYRKEGVKDLVMLTEKGKTWNAKINSDSNPSSNNNSDSDPNNSDSNPNELGNKSENTGKNSDSDPTDKDTSINKNTNDKNTNDKGTDKPTNSKKKKLTDYPDDFKPTDKQIEKMNKYGIDIPLFLETFKSGTKSKGTKYKCWTSALTTWINNEIKFNKLVPVADRPFSIDDEDWSNPNAPARYQQPDAYHPSHQLDKPMIDTRPNPPVADNWHWKEPLPNMSIPETYKYLKDNRKAGETEKKAYDRLFAEMQGGASRTQ